MHWIHLQERVSLGFVWHGKNHGPMALPDLQLRFEGVRRGTFSPDRTPPPETFAALHARIAETLGALEKIEPTEINSFIGREMCFVRGEHRLEFTAENFLLSFSQPNFYFHAATAYDILRWKGVQIGKRDFTGALRLKR